MSIQHASPFDIQELVDHCISLLAESHSNLKSCALVARSWVHAAQSHLFRRIPSLGPGPGFPAEEWWMRLHNALKTFPHLLRLVQELILQPSNTDTEKTFFTRICTLPFTHLETVSISAYRSDEMALQQLFSCPSVRRIKLNSAVEHWSFFEHIWERCSPTIRHLDLSSYIWISVDPSSRIPERVAPIQLHSLRLWFWGRSTDIQLDAVYSWAIYPFDLSHLKALSIRDTLGFPWKRCHTESVEILEVWSMEYPIDLSAFPHLSLLRINLDASDMLPMVLGTLSTIAPSNCIHTISIVCSSPLDTMECIQLDSKLTTLPMSYPFVVEFELDFEWPSHELVECFPALISRDMLRFVRHEEGLPTADIWWKSVVDGL
ncbi:hypothetical protein B0H13DRAFT_1004725 [Mycena leptocephala]|nr:hypothetical protein B0H13DRAFT_1004725 [Mycena leptocephala]